LNHATVVIFHAFDPKGDATCAPPPQYLPPLPPTSSISLMVSHRDQASHLTKQVVELAKIISNPKFIDFPPIPMKDTPLALLFRKISTQLNQKGNPLISAI